MHAILAAALAELDVTARLHAGSCTEPCAGLLCFQQITPGDLLVGPAKVAGSAQRKQRGALMQHGSLLLAASPHAPVLPGIRELSGHMLAIEETWAAIVQQFSRQTGWDLVATGWTDDERRRKLDLAATKYTLDAWNRKR